MVLPRALIKVGEYVPLSCPHCTGAGSSKKQWACMLRKDYLVFNRQTCKRGEISGLK